MRTFAILSVLLIASCSTSGSSQPDDTQASYCPDCNMFCGQGCPLASNGNCKACDTKPVKLDASMTSWFWCSHHNGWHESEACAENMDEKCCSEKNIMALGEGDTEADYCPDCGHFFGDEIPLTDDGKCRKCGKPPVKAASVSRTFFKCTSHNAWHKETCGRQGDEDCCTEKQVTILGKGR